MILTYRHKLIIGLSLAVMMTSLGCAKGLVESRSSERRNWDDPPTHPLPVFDSQTIDRPYKVIGIISVKSGSFKRKQSALYKLKFEAVRMGGQALLDFRQGGVDVQGVQNEKDRTSPFHLYSAKVIVFVEQGKE